MALADFSTTVSDPVHVKQFLGKTNISAAFRLFVYMTTVAVFSETGAFEDRSQSGGL